MAWTGSTENYLDFVDRHGIMFPNLDDTSAELYGRFQVPYQPAFAAIGTDGQVETLLGAADGELLDMIIEGMIG